ncbi:hypothetical protein JCM16418_3408 [Paenibacillus pini JCM 16418]|uniref:Uncharacterized protein n=1 Tax=Paenibacillus pini JCM 16418 TaxID=1236976 RepID=W7YL71_9BACL|nr:hypothetical protein JCM16418_3408 [Paenibacillus pini JCM 16418]
MYVCPSDTPITLGAAGMDVSGFPPVPPPVLPPPPLLPPPVFDPPPEPPVELPLMDPLCGPSTLVGATSKDEPLPPSLIVAVDTLPLPNNFINALTTSFTILASLLKVIVLPLPSTVTDSTDPFRISIFMFVASILRSLKVPLRVEFNPLDNRTLINPAPVRLLLSSRIAADNTVVS